MRRREITDNKEKEKRKREEIVWTTTAEGVGHRGREIRSNKCLSNRGRFRVVPAVVGQQTRDNAESLQRGKKKS